MIVVTKPGMLASVQDLGRYGHRHLGVCPGGALDVMALTVANRLVGNADGAAGIEITMGMCEIRFESATRIALTGAPFGARLDGQLIWSYWSVPVAAGQTLKLGGASTVQRPGLRTWLAVAGGIDVPVVLGSRSTDLKAGFGGHEGRALRKGDRLILGSSLLTPEQLTRRQFGALPPNAIGDDQPVTTLRILPGPEHEQFTIAARKQLCTESWRITPQSNRMGSRLAGPELKRKRAADMLSAGVIPGTIQVPPSGQPIVLMGDAQTTGGYPRIAVVIRADLWKLAQAPLGGELRLEEVDATTAQSAWNEQQRYLAMMAQGLSLMGWPSANASRSAAPPQETEEEGAQDAD